MTRRSIISGERRHSDPDLQTDELGNLIDVINSLLKQSDGVVALSGKSVGEPNRFQQIGSCSYSQFVARDTVTGYFIKGARPDTASAEYGTMNYLNATLTAQEVGISAVRHAYMVVPSDDWLPTVNVVEPARGKTLHVLYLMETISSSGNIVPLGYEKCDKAITIAAERLDGALTKDVRRVLTSDLHSNNIFFDDDGTYTIIDQPNPGYSMDAAHWLNQHL